MTTYGPVRKLSFYHPIVDGEDVTVDYIVGGSYKPPTVNDPIGDWPDVVVMAVVDDDGRAVCGIDEEWVDEFIDAALVAEGRRVRAAAPYPER